MVSIFRFITLLLAFSHQCTSADAATCRKVDSSDSIRINASSQKSLARIGISREAIFEALKDVSIPETSGCWSGFTGNFDGQIVSMGVLQWNYGQNSLQPIMRAYRNQFSTELAFKNEIDRIMPNHGKWVMSHSCLTIPITLDCKVRFLEAQRQPDSLSSLKRELNALFESNEMIQVQTDRFVRLLESVRDDLERMFRGSTPSVRRIKWAIDTKVQQGSFPGNTDIERVRSSWTKLDDASRKRKLHSLILWYQGLSDSPDQDGASQVFENSKIWNERISSNSLSDEQIDLLHLSFLKSRTAQGQAGRWQALTFQRRAKIIFGVGCVAGQCDGI